MGALSLLLHPSFVFQLVDVSFSSLLAHWVPDFPSLQYYDDAAGILRMVILSAVQPHRLLAAPPQPLPQHACGDVVLETVDGSQHGMHYNMSMDDMRSQVAGEEDK